MEGQKQSGLIVCKGDKRVQTCLIVCYGNSLSFPPCCSIADGISFEVSLSLNCTDLYKREGGA